MTETILELQWTPQYRDLKSIAQSRCDWRRIHHCDFAK
jgi:UDP-glucose 4-epimerase